MARKTNKRKKENEVIEQPKREPIHATLYNYQRAAVNFIKQRNRVGLFLDIGLGKAIDNETIIPTPDGNKKVGEIKVGDYLYDRKGKPTKVLAVYPHKNKRAFKVTLKDGRSFIACNEHLIPYYQWNDTSKIRVKPLGDMLDDYVSGERKQKKYQIPQNQAVQFDERHHIIHPYVMGVFLGSGAMTEVSLCVTTSQPDVIQKIAKLMDIPENHITKVYDSNNEHKFRTYFTHHENAERVKIELHRLGLRGLLGKDKFIPKSYLYDSKQNRMELLKGLMDSNGYITKTGIHSSVYKYKTTSEQLANDVKSLVLSLGFGFTLTREQTIPNEKHNRKYHVTIFTPELIVSSKRHMEKAKTHKYKGKRHEYTAIVGIQEVEPRDMTCFTVDNDEQLFLINDYIVTHNTLITLTALVELAQEGRLFGHVLVIAPKRIAINTWPDEIEKWAHSNGARFQVLAGLTKKKRDAILDTVKESPPTIYIINRELVPKLVERFPGEQWAFMNVIIDEAQSFKGYNTKGFKALKSIAPYTHRWIELTGSPSPNGLMDIWALIYLLDGGQRLGHNITAYRKRHFIPGRRTPEGYPYEWIIKDGHDQIIHQSIQDVAISMMKKDYLTNLPDLIHNPIELEMTESERAVYNHLRKEKILPLVDGEVIEASNAAVLSGALLQLSNGAIYANEEKKEIIELHQHKLDALEEIVEGSNGQPILCFYWYKHDILRLKKRFPNAEVFNGDPEQLARWNRKEIPLLFAQPQSAGHGLNFQYGGHILVFFVVPTSLELYEQTIGRLYRNGQTETVIVHYLKMRGTVEDRIISRLIEKQYTQQALIDAVKADIDNLI